MQAAGTPRQLTEGLHQDGPMSVCTSAKLLLRDYQHVDTATSQALSKLDIIR